MFSQKSRHAKQLTVSKKLIEHLAEIFNVPISVRLWDGELLPLGQNINPDLFVSISGPGVIGSLLRWPTFSNLLKHYAQGNIDFHGTDLLTFIDIISVKKSRKQSQKIKKSLLIRSMIPFLFEPSSSTQVYHEYQGDDSGRKRQQVENLDFIQFHYDVSNEFYELFLDKEMTYTCGYFTDWNNSLDQAQLDKLDLTCRKLQLQPGEKFLDIGFGWGGLLCHAAKHYGVYAHGVTLSENQLLYTQEKVRKLGLEDVVTVEICDYADLKGQYDKIASIGMYEHVGIDNLPQYMKDMNALLKKNGLFLLQGITRRGKASMKEFRKLNVERRLLTKYIFPGGEVDHLGHMLQCFETGGFEVADVEGWRNHYMQTCKMWSQRLYQNRDKAIEYVGKEKYRMWLLYLTGCSLTFKNGSARLYQVLAEKPAKREESGMPPTREHLYQKKAA